MPKRSANYDDYDDDDGFVVDASTSKPKPSSKKQKTTPSSAIKASSSSSNAVSGSLPGGGHVGKDGEYWEISGKRRLQLSTFNGKQMINIREYYEKEGEMLPGKKGISLTMEQFDAVVALLPCVEDVLRVKGYMLKRPDYGRVAGGDGGDGSGQAGGDGEGEADGEEEEMKDGVEEEEEEEEDGEEQARRKGRHDKAGKDKKKKKKNYEDTSEDEW